MLGQYVSESAGRNIQVEKRFAATTFKNKCPKWGGRFWGNASTIDPDSPSTFPSKISN